MPKKRKNNICFYALAFYRKYFKKYSLLHAFLIRVYRLILPLSWRFIYLIKLIENRDVYKLIKISEYENFNHAHKTILLPQVLEVKPSKVYPTKVSTYFKPNKHEQVFPGISIITICDAIVTGKSNIVFSGSKAICHDLYDFNKDYTSEELHLRFVVVPKIKRLAIIRKIKYKRTLPLASCFTDACSSNYAHWLTEVLPRIYHFYEAGLSKECPLILDRNLHPNLMQSLHMLIGKNVNLVKLGSNRQLKVKQLNLISATGYVPFDIRSNKYDEYSHGVFSPLTFKAMVNKIRDGLDLSPVGIRKLYIRRNSKVRVLDNADEIEALLVQQGFKVVEPEKLSFTQQVKLFSEADIVVGATGAAMANLLFCRPESIIVIMMALHEKMPYRYWQNIAAAVGNNVTYVLGRITDSDLYGIHANFIIEIEDLLQALEMSSAKMTTSIEKLYQ